MTAVPVRTAGPPMGPTGCPISPTAAAFDPFDGMYQSDPAGSLRHALVEEPVFYSPTLGHWVITRYDDIKAIFRDPVVFSAANVLEQLTPLTDDAADILRGYGVALEPTIVDEDGPEHVAHRRALSEPFAVASVERLIPRMREVVDGYLDRIVTRGHADLVDDFIYDVPCIIALIFLGVPDEDIETCRQFGMHQTVFVWGRPDAQEQVRVAESMGRYWEFAGRLVERLKETPDAQGWIPHAIRMQTQRPDLFSDNYLQNIMMGGILAAHETTTNAAANAMRLLLENRAAWDEVCADRSLIPNAIEECLRLAGSVVAWRRITTIATTVGGVAIPAKSRLLIVTATANRDEAVFEHPEDFDVRRRNAKRHLTFGLGRHTCLGAALARAELKVIFEALSARLPHMELVEGQRFTYLPNTSFRGPQHVLVTWDAVANPCPADRPGQAS